MTTPDLLKEVKARRAMPCPADRRRIRERAGVSQRAIGELIGTSGQAVANYEGGRRLPRGRTLIRYVDILVTLGRLGEEQRP